MQTNDCNNYDRTTIANNTKIVKDTECAHFLNTICSAEQPRDCLQCLMQGDDKKPHEVMLISDSDNTTVSETPDIKEHIIEQLTQPTISMELSKDESRKGRHPQGRGESNSVCFPLVKGCVTVTIASMSFPALIDTGASVSFISAKLVGVLHKANHPITFFRIKDRVVLADNKSYSIAQRVVMNIGVGELKVKQSFHVLPNLNRPMIMGINFLKKHRAKIQFEPSDVDKPPYKLRAQNSIKIQVLVLL